MKKENKHFHIDALPVPEQGTASYRGILQLYKSVPELGHEPINIFPVTYTQAVYDGKTGANLEHILHQFNFVWLQFQGTGQATRNLLPPDMRRRGITISYRNIFNNVVVERNINESESLTDNWGLDEYWEEVHTAEEIRDWVMDYVTNYIDARIDEVYTYIDQKVSEIYVYIDGKIEDVTEYIDEKVTELTTYIDNKITEVTNYIDTQISNLETSLTQYIDSQISSIQSSLTQYIDSSISSMETTIRSWVTNQISSAVSSIDLSDYATQDWVLSQISGSIGDIDLSDYATIDWVREQINNIDIGDVEIGVDLVTNGSGNNWLADNGEYTNPFPIVSEEEVVTILPNLILSHRPVQQMWSVIEEEVELDSSQLNTNYPDVAIGYTVIQFGIGCVYQKVTEVGQWIKYDVELLLL